MLEFEASCVTRFQIPNAESCQYVGVEIEVSSENITVSEAAGTVPVCVTLTDTGNEPVLLEPITFEFVPMDITTCEFYGTPSHM